MPIPISKTITKWVKVNGDVYQLILVPDKGLGTFTGGKTTITLRRLHSRSDEGSATLEELLEWLTNRFDTTSSKHDSMVKSLRRAKDDRHYDNIAYKDILSRVGALHVKLADQLREIVDDIYEVNCLASDLSDEELVKRGIDPLN